MNYAKAIVRFPNVLDYLNKLLSELTDNKLGTDASMLTRPTMNWVMSYIVR